MLDENNIIKGQTTWTNSLDVPLSNEIHIQKVKTATLKAMSIERTTT